MGEGDDDNFEDAVEKKITVNELLASAQHAIITGKTKIEIEVTFSKFYSEATINKARGALVNLALLPPKITRKTDKTKELSQIIDCLQKTDWQGANVNFAAIDLGQICSVSSGIGDEMQFRMEIRELRNKFETLANEVGQLNKLTDVDTTAAENIKNAGRGCPEQVNLFSAVVAGKNTRIPSQRRLVSPPLTQQVALRNYQSDLPTPSPEDEVNDITKNFRTDDDFITVKRKKRTKPKIVQGKAPSNLIKTVPKARVGMLFATRFAPETKTDDIMKMVEQNDSNTHTLLKVEELPAKHNSYKSFKLCFDLQNLPLSQFLRSMEDPNKWAEGVFIRPFRITRQSDQMWAGKGSAKKINSTE